MNKLRELLHEKFFYPDEFIDSIANINYDALYDKDIRGLIFDIDNTIVAYNVFEVSDIIVDLFGALIKKGFTICLLSNNKRHRVSYFGELLNIKAFHTALKPTQFGLRRAIKSLSLPKNQLAIIGDQIFTDVLCGKIQKIYTVLVEPIAMQNSFVDKLKRKLELSILKTYTTNK
jgi:HAD superfamily phosphatase (TIGR01668 family)